MTNQAQAIREFIEAGKKGEMLPCPFCGENLVLTSSPDTEAYWLHPRTPCAIAGHRIDPVWKHHLAAWNTRAIDLSDLLDVVREMAELLREDCCGECDGTGEVFDQASNMAGAHGWMTCWKCYDTLIAKTLRRARPYLGGE